MNTSTDSNLTEVPKSDDGYRVGQDPTSKVGFFGATPVDQPDALTADVGTDLTHTAPSSDDFAVQDLTNSSPFGFVTKDEGNSVLKLVANLQTRVKELEARLEELGAIASN